MDPLFNSHLYIILLKLIDQQLKPHTSNVLAFVQSIFTNHPYIFTETQTMQLIIRISLVGITSYERKQADISQEVFQILQFFLKYTNYSAKLLNICLFTMCILVNREPLIFPVWNLLKNMIIENDYIFQEIIGILQIENNLPFWNQNAYDKSANMKKEIQFKCFKGEMSENAVELSDLLQCLTMSQVCHQKDVPKSSYMKKMTLQELVCSNECPSKRAELNQYEEIAQLDKRSSKVMRGDMYKSLVSLIEHDRVMWISTFEKTIDRVYKGAVYLIGRVLWSTEKIPEILYPINLVLKFFNTLIKTTDQYTVINEVLTAVKILIMSKDVHIYFQWSSIIDILNSSTAHMAMLVEKKRLDVVQEIFRIIKGQILTSQFPEHLVQQTLVVYMKYKNARAISDKTLTQLSLDHMLNNDFLNSFEALLESCLQKEKNVEIRQLFLDKVQDFYAETEDLETCNLLEAIFLNNLEYFYLTRVEDSFKTAQMIQIIDILTYMVHKSEKSSSFKHIIEILEQCILCYDFDKSSFDPARMAMETPRGTIARKDILTQLTPEQMKMKPFQNHALNRLIQLFVLKGQCMAETEKSVYIYTVLLKILKVSANDRKTVICNDLLENLRVNSYRELCWLTTDNPLVIEIQTKYYYNNQTSDENRQSDSGSQGNSSSSGSHPTNSAIPRGPRSFGEQMNAMNNRTSLDKLGQDKQIIQNTLKTLIYCFEDVQLTSIEIRLNCLRLFHKFMAFISEEDFLNLEYAENVTPHLRQQVSIDNKAEWIKIVQTLIKNFDPISQPDFALLIMDIFYSILGLESYYKLLSQNLLSSIVEKLMETLFLVSNTMHKKLKAETAEINAREQSMMKKGSTRDTQSLKKSLSDVGQVVDGGLEENNATVKELIKVSKKALSLVGYIFLIDNSYSAQFWNLQAKEQLPYFLPAQGSDFTVLGQTQKLILRPDAEIKLIEYLVDQLTAITLNNQIMFQISHHILVCISNIISAVQRDKDFQVHNPFLIDSLIFIITRIMLPFMINNQELSDPVHRVNQGAHKMKRSLKELYQQHYLTFQLEDKFYYKCLSQKGDYDNLQKHLIISNLSKLLTLKGISDEQTVQPLVVLLSSFDATLSVLKDKLEAKQKGRSNEIVKHEANLRQFLGSVAQNVIWISHSVYDRNCNTQLDDNMSSGIHHYMWNKNILTVRQIGTIVDLIVRNAAYNYRANIDTQNKLQQVSSGNIGQVSKMKNMLMRQSKGRSYDNLNDSPAHQQLQNIILNDSTLMALMDFNSNQNFKKTKELLCMNDDVLVRSYLKALDTIHPKNVYCIGVTYIPRDASKDSLKSLFDISISPDQVSDNHLNFLSMLGRMMCLCNGDESLKGLNEGLYLSNLSPVNLILNEDESNFIYYVSNALNTSMAVNEEGLLNQPNFIRDKIHIIYNESNIQDFTCFDETKIYLVFSKLNEAHYQFELQHARSQQNLAKFETQFEQVLTEPNQEKSSSMFAFEENSVVQPPGIKQKKYQNGHLCKYAIIAQDKVGEWVKQLTIMSDMFDKNQRKQNRDYITSSIMQRQACIKDLRGKFAKLGKPITILKQ